jgi:DNA invertase Pin-like site-specific DNA recombinase
MREKDYRRPEAGDAVAQVYCEANRQPIAHPGELRDPVVNRLRPYIAFKSLQENMDTTTSGGKLIFHICGALSVFEREVIRERTNPGFQAARARGRLGGRPKLQALDLKKIALAKKLYDDGYMPVICDTLQIGRSSLYRYRKSASLI